MATFNTDEMQKVLQDVLRPRIKQGLKNFFSDFPEVVEFIDTASDEDLEKLCEIHMRCIDEMPDIVKVIYGYPT